MTKVLFILKCRDLPYAGEEKFFEHKKSYSYCMSSGLLNSATLVSDMLVENGVESKVVQVIDNNDIDREVNKYKPTHVMIEALWVVPEKFHVLRKLHPKVKWIIRLHSEIPFLANEGIAVEWMNAYIKQHNVYLAPNSHRLYADLVNYYKAVYKDTHDKIILLPNYYNREPEREVEHDPHVLNVGCFGAIRPLKNQLIQAYAAIEYARHTHKKLRFHINSQRVEQAGNSALKNIIALFADLDPNKYELVQHPWMHHHEFRKLVRKMNIGMQVSFTETFNIVTADFVSQDIPIVVSEEVEWASGMFKVGTDDAAEIADKMSKAITLGKFGTFFNKLGLAKYNKESVKAYLHFLHHSHRC
jgi:hypothetical protein